MRTLVVIEVYGIGNGSLYFFYAVKCHVFQQLVLDDAIHTLGHSIVLRVTTLGHADADAA